MARSLPSPPSQRPPVANSSIPGLSVSVTLCSPKYLRKFVELRHAAWLDTELQWFVCFAVGRRDPTVCIWQLTHIMGICFHWNRQPIKQTTCTYRNTNEEGERKLATKPRHWPQYYALPQPNESTHTMAFKGCTHCCLLLPLSLSLPYCSCLCVLFHTTGRTDRAKRLVSLYNLAC